MVGTRYVRNSELVSRAIGDETILVPLGGVIVDLRCLFSLNETGSLVWAQLAKPRTVDEVAVALTETYTVTLAQARQDAKRLVARLVSQGCARVADPPRAPARPRRGAPTRRRGA